MAFDPLGGFGPPRLYRRRLKRRTHRRHRRKSMKKLEKKHPLAIRWFHWINFPLLALMIWSGILIYWAYPRYVKLPQTTWRALHINNRLAEGMALHFFFMWFF